MLIIFLPFLALYGSSFGLVPIDGMPVQHLHLSRTSVVVGELLVGKIGSKMVIFTNFFLPPSKVQC